MWKLASIAVFALSGAAPEKSPTASLAEHVLVAMSDFSFSPAELILHHGQAYVLDFTNTSERPHTFTAVRFFTHAKLLTEEKRAINHGGFILAAGSSQTITLIAPSAGVYDVRCMERDHVAMGMTGRIQVL